MHTKENNLVQTGFNKTKRNRHRLDPIKQLKKPSWIKIKLHSGDLFEKTKNILRKNQLNTVCEEASCPNIHECFSSGTATFMILGKLCTRRCPFCDVAHGRPGKVDTDEPKNLAQTIKSLGLKYVVITSVDRDDLRDGGSSHFVNCIKQIRENSKKTKIEILTPDFRGRLLKAVSNFKKALPDVMNHNLETVPRLYKAARPGANYLHSLELLKTFKNIYPETITKSGIMVGLGETDDEIYEVMEDLRKHNVDMITIGQYLQPTPGHIQVQRYVKPEMFAYYKTRALDLGFSNAACGPLVRSSYHAEEQSVIK